MTPDKERIELYRKWFNTFLIREFLDLPVKQQERFLILSDKFIKNCHKIHEEAKKIKEKVIHLKVTNILNPDNKSENYIIVGITEKSEVKIEYPSSIKKPNPGDILQHVVYSIDGEIWYSSKSELITGRNL